MSSTLTPLAIRFNDHVIDASVQSASMNVDLGTYLPAGTRIYLALDRVNLADYYYLLGSQRTGYLQLLHPVLDRWTTPLQIQYTATPVHAISTMTLSNVLGLLVPGLSGNSQLAPVVRKLDLMATLLMPGYYDAPKYYTTFYG